MSAPSTDHAPAGSRAGFIRTWRWATFLENLTLRHRRGAWLMIVAFYLLSLNGLWRVGPDSALYLCLGRSIARGEGYVYLGEAHRLVYPGLPFLIAAAIKVGPQHAMVIILSAMVGCALLTLALCEQLFRLVVRPGTALVATAMLCVCFQFYSKAYEVLTDMPFLLGTVMVLLGGALCGLMPARPLDKDAHLPTARERKLGWVMLPLGFVICTAMRPTFYVLGATVVVAALIALIRERKWRQVAGAVAAIVLVGLVFWLISRSDPRRVNGQDIYEEAVSWQLKGAMQDMSVPLAHARQIISPELPTAFLSFYIAKGGDYVVVALLLLAVVWALRRWPAALLLIGFTFAVQVIVAPVPRYMMPILPLLVLGWWTAAGRLSERFFAPIGNVITFSAYLLLLPNTCRCVGQIWYEQYQRPFLAHYDHGRYAVLDELSQAIQFLPPDAVILVPADTTSLVAFMADRWCISLSEPIPEHMRAHPLFVAYVEGNPVYTALAGERVTIGEKIATTTSAYEKIGPLVLCRATIR